MFWLRNGKRLALALVLFVLFAPLIHNWKPFYQEKPIHGETFPFFPDFTWESWFSGDYQESAVEAIPGELGLRPTLIRSHNEVSLRIFKEMDHPEGELGLDHWIFSRNEFTVWSGFKRKLVPRIPARAKKFKRLQDKLDSMGIGFMFVVAPSKPSIYPELLPENRKYPNPSLADICLEEFQKVGLNHIEFISLFKELKAQDQYPLFSKFGLHWNEYGSLHAMDHLLTELEKKYDWNLNHPVVDSLIIHDTLNVRNRDLLMYLETFSMDLKFSMAYPAFHLTNKDSADKPSVLVIADSFYEIVQASGIPSAAFSRADYWFYNRQLFIEPNGENPPLQNINLKGELKKYDLVLFLAHEANIHTVPFGFEQQFFKALGN